jgi:hypothetical protein
MMHRTTLRSYPLEREPGLFPFTAISKIGPILMVATGLTTISPLP